MKRPADLDDDTTYQLVTAKRSRGGIVPRERLTGRQIKTKTQFFCSKGDFLISRRQIIHGACGIVPLELDGAVVSNEYTTLSVNGSLLLPYLEALSHTTYFQMSCFHSSIGVDVEKMIFKLDDWLRVRLPIPPLPEQRKIAAILSSVDEAIRATQAVIEQTRRVKEGLLQDLLTKGIGHTRFKETKIGEIPESWSLALLDEVAGRGSGHTPSKQFPEYWNGDIKWVSLADSHALDRVYLDQTDKTISPAGIANSSAVVHPAGTVFVSRDASVGRSAIAACDLAVSQHFIAWRCGPRLHNHFLYYLLQRHKPQFERIAVGSTIKTIGLGYFKRLKIALPDRSEQEAIAERLLSHDQALWVHEGEVARLQRVKAGLLQDLLTGKVRVTP